MRRSLLLLCATGCFAEPHGRAQSWPPSDITVRAVTAGDLDGDGLSDVVVVAAGATDPRHTTGLYLLDGHDDLATLPPTTFTTFAPLDVPGAASLAIGHPANEPPRVYLALASDAGGSIVSLDARLTDEQDVAADLPGDLWLAADPAGLLVSNGLGVTRVAPDLSSTIPVTPPDGAATWSGARIGSVAGTAIIVATPTAIYRSPTLDSPAWTQLRTGPSWTGQRIADLGDGHTTVLGVAPDTQQICTYDTDVRAITCGGVLVSTSDRADALAGAIEGDPGIKDVITVVSAGGSTRVFIHDDALAQSNAIETFMLDLAEPRAVVVTESLGEPQQLLVFAGDGAVRCATCP